VRAFAILRRRFCRSRHLDCSTTAAASTRCISARRCARNSRMGMASGDGNGSVAATADELAPAPEDARPAGVGHMAESRGVCYCCISCQPRAYDRTNNVSL